MNRDQKDIRPKIVDKDSGYSSSENLENQKTLEAVRAREVRKFKDLLNDLNTLELSDSDEKYEAQETKLKYYLVDNIPKEETQREKEKFFYTLDRALEGYLTNTLLDNNEGAAFLAVVRVCLNKQVLISLIEAISLEKKQTKEHLIKRYIDNDNSNILHCLIDTMIKKYDSGLVLKEKDWEAFDYFCELVPALKNQQNSLKRTPEGILIEYTDISLEHREYYIVPIDTTNFCKH